MPGCAVRRRGILLPGAAALVKDERHIDRFDQVFSHVFMGTIAGESAVDIANIRKNGCAGLPRST